MTITSPKVPWLLLADGRHWPTGDDGHRLLRKANAVGRDLHRKLLIQSGKRTNYEQWVAYEDYLGGGNLAAPCCWRHYRHSWADCGRQCMSNHCRSRALDIGVITKAGEYVSMGLYHRDGLAPISRILANRGLVLPLWRPGFWSEPWHMTERRYPG